MSLALVVVYAEGSPTTTKTMAITSWPFAGRDGRNTVVYALTK